MKKICIVGGGTAGWFTAAFLAKQFKNKHIEISLVESKDIPIIGVGESVTPHVKNFLVHHLEIDEKEWMKETGAIFKLANKFIGWNHKHHNEYFSFTYAFPETLLPYGPKSFDDYFPNGKTLTTDLFLKLYQEGKLDKFDKYFNPQYAWMENQKFHVGKYDQYYGTSHHIDADKTGNFVKEKVALPHGVTHIIGTINDVKIIDGRIKSVTLDNSEEIYADYFIDCTGFTRLLISKLTNKIKKYNHPIDRAVVGRTSYLDPTKEMTNYTQSIAQDKGWIFRVTLRERLGNGYCYSSSYETDQEAINNFTSKFPVQPRQLKWNPERLIEPCKGNVLTVGLANGFVEPLEANNLYTIIASVRLVSDFLQEYVNTGKENHKDFNKKIGYAIDDIYEFLIVHYTLTNTRRSNFWKDMQLIGDQDNHIDLVYNKFQDPKNNMVAAFNGETMFPDYMWLQFAISWGIDVSKWQSKKILTKINDGYNYYQNIFKENFKLSSQSLNYFEGHERWLTKS